MPASPLPDRDETLAAFMQALDDEAYFEAHEVLESYWVSYRGDDRDFYKGLIQAAVAMHHRAAGNAVGFAGVAFRARGLLAPFSPRHAGVDVEAMLARLDAA